MCIIDCLSTIVFILPLYLDDTKVIILILWRRTFQLEYWRTFQLVSTISGLTQGMFVGSVSDNFNERIEQKIFHCEIVVDAEKVKREESAYKKIPVITDFTDEDGNDHMKETVQANYRRIKEEVKQIVQDELERIAGDDNLKHLLQQK